VIIAGGRIMYDGSLAGIIDRFSGSKIITLQLSGEIPVAELHHYGEVLDHVAPKVRLRIDRTKIPEVLAALLARFTIEDVSVEDPPLEDVIASAFKGMEEETRN
jgi:ABC-2 type transport system ATP-binding protein